MCVSPLTANRLVQLLEAAGVPPGLVNVRNLNPCTINPKPETRNPKPETRNPEPKTRSPKLGTQNTEPQTPNPKPHPLKTDVERGRRQGPGLEALLCREFIDYKTSMTSY